MVERLPQLESLRVFEACARYGNFTQAAAELGVSPAAVSQRMRELQLELGISLFVRNGPKIRLTEAGAGLSVRMREIMRLTRSAVAECRTDAALRISTTPTFAARWLAPRLAEYQARDDAVPVILDVSVDIRESGSFDIAIRSGQGEWPGFEAVQLFPVEATPMLSPHLLDGHRLDRPEGLLNLPLLADTEWPRWFQSSGVEIDAGRRDFMRIGYPTQDLAAVAALEGAGVALLSPRLFANYLADGRLIRPFDTVLRGPTGYWLLVADGPRNARSDGFCAWLLSMIDAENSELVM